MILADVSTQSVLIWIAAAITSSFGLLVYLGSSNRSSRYFLLTVASVVAWMITVGAFISAGNTNFATALVKLAYFFGTLVACSFLLFFVVYPDDRKPSSFLLSLISLILIGAAHLFLNTELIIAEAHLYSGISRYGWTFGSWWLLFYVVFYALFLSGFILLFYKAFLQKDKSLRNNAKYMFWGVLVLISPPTAMNIVMPQFGLFQFIWLGPMLSFGWVSVIGYSILKFRQLNIRTFTTELLAISLLIIFFVNIFTSLSGSAFGRGLTFIVFLIVGYYFVKLTVQVEDLNVNLKKKVAEQTQEIRRSYEVEKKARVELERLNEAKDQFIRVTEHHLRTPITEIKWYLEMIQKGEVSIKDRKITAKKGLQAADRLRQLVDDFLNVAALQAGKDILNRTNASMFPIVSEVLRELHESIVARKISVTCSQDDSLWPPVSIDTVKMKEVIFVVLQNAVNYNVEGGSITITPQTDEHFIKVIIKDSGIGIDTAERDRIMKEIFNRGRDAVKANPLGMGLGLTLAHFIVEAHGGRISLESAGKHKGSTVTISLPLDIH